MIYGLTGQFNHVDHSRGTGRGAGRGIIQV